MNIVKEYLNKIIAWIKKYWTQTPKKNKLFHGGVAVGVIGLSLALVLLLNVTDYVPLYDQLSSMSQNEKTEIMGALAQIGAIYELDGKGVIIVPKELQATYQGQLAMQGYPKSGFNYDIFDGIDMTTSDFEKKQLAVFQLQERIAAGISTFEGVRQAHVTVQLQDDSAFVLARDRTPATASVIVHTATGYELTPAQVEGILHYIETSVPGLKYENITLNNGYGEDLKTITINGTDPFTQQMDIQRWVDSNLKQKISSVLLPLYGANGFMVMVNSAINIDNKVQEKTDYEAMDDRGTGVLGQYTWEQEYDITDSNTEGIPGTTTNWDVPGYPSNNGDAVDGYARNYGQQDYYVDSLREQIEKVGYTVDALSVMISVDSSVFGDRDIDELRNVVSVGAGIDISRVSVYSAPFIYADVGAPSNQQFWITLIIIIALVLLIAAGVIIFVIMNNRKKAALAAEAAALAAADYSAWQDYDESVAPIEKVESREDALKNEIRELAATSPEIVAQLLRTWLKSEDD